MDRMGGQPVITTLGLVEGDVLTYLERHGTTTLRHLIRQLDWPARMVMMAVGGLIREHLVQATQRELEVLVALAPEARAIADTSDWGREWPEGGVR
jgi:hypothetical protein